MEDLLSRELEKSRLSHIMERMALRISPLLAYYNISDLRGAKFKCQVHPGLPDTIEQSNHIFLVTKAYDYVKASTGKSAKKPFVAYNFGKT
ncbi:hypothetical protein SLS53_006020 [Cytospora paraplurivora]|uniref:Uncharacterized protein n=1 Tax=Cytospora paraplurivora TaxID=2898453 RepID=A0AAN9U5Q4_9PEZI